MNYRSLFRIQSNYRRNALTYSRQLFFLLTVQLTPEMFCTFSNKYYECSHSLGRPHTWEELVFISASKTYIKLALHF